MWYAYLQKAAKYKQHKVCSRCSVLGLTVVSRFLRLHVKNNTSPPFDPPSVVNVHFVNIKRY